MPKTQAPKWWQMVPPGKIFNGADRFKVFVASPPLNKGLTPQAKNWEKPTGGR